MTAHPQQMAEHDGFLFGAKGLSLRGVWLLVVGRVNHLVPPLVEPSPKFFYWDEQFDGEQTHVAGTAILSALET